MDYFVSPGFTHPKHSAPVPRPDIMENDDEGLLADEITILRVLPFLTSIQFFSRKSLMLNRKHNGFIIPKAQAVRLSRLVIAISRLPLFL